MDELVEYTEPYARVVVSRDGDDLVFWSDFDDNGRSIQGESRIPVADYVARFEGPWPWYDLGYRRKGALLVLDALGTGRAPWTDPLPPEMLALFDRARDGRGSIVELLTAGTDPDTLDPCGATPLWYAVRSLGPDAALALIDAGADVGHRIDLTARGERFTTILHEIMRCGRTDALRTALARGADPSPRDSAGATPMHALDDHTDHIHPEMVTALSIAGADVNAQDSAGLRPIDVAARLLLTRTVSTLLDLGADPAGAIEPLLRWWVANVRWAAYRAPDVAGLVEILRAGGATVTPIHRELASTAGVDAVITALRNP